jgi:hypothetical protein
MIRKILKFVEEAAKSQKSSGVNQVADGGTDFAEATVTHLTAVRLWLFPLVTWRK